MQSQKHEDDKALQEKEVNQDSQENQEIFAQVDADESEKIKQEDYQDFIKMRNKMNNSPFKRKSSKSVEMFTGNKLRDFQKSIPDLKLITRKSNMREAFLEDDLGQNQDDVNQENLLQVQDSPDCSPVPKMQGQNQSRQPNLQIISPMLKSRSSTGKMAQDESQNNFGTNSEFVIDRESMKSLSQRSGLAQDERPDGSQSALQKPSPSKDRIGSSKLNLMPEQRRSQRQDDSEIKSATLRPTLGLGKDNDKARPQDQSDIKAALYPPPEDIYRSKVRVKHDCVNYGLNMYFKKAHEFSADPDQAGGDLAPNQTFSSMPWGVMGCPVAKQENITDYVRKNIKDVVFSRYGMDYLRSFPRCDDLAIGSYRINLDYLIFQKQRHLDTDNNASLVGMSFLKTKGQVEMNRQIQQTQNASPDRKGANVAMGASMIIPFYKNLEPDDRQTLLFDSVFESGNLAVALKVSDNEYNCLLQNDINTNGHTQWFYFKVKSNFAKKTTVKINLINLYKAKSLYQYGMRVLCLDVSKKDPKPGEDPSAHSLPKWQRSGSEVSYIQNRFTNEQSPNGLFQVQFSFEFEAGPREIYFAHSMPFTYSMLNEYLNKKAIKSKCKRVVLCHSLAGNKVEYLYITNKVKKPEIPLEPEGNLTARKNEKESVAVPPGKDPGFKRQKSLTKKNKVKPIEVKPIQKQVILLTSRVHPGETNASWMMQGLLNTLLDPRNEEEEELVKNLKDHFEFYIVPMLNVDGVINGNYRCSLASCDLNRKWLKPSKALHPPVYYTKKLCQQLIETEKKQFFLYLDFHGHSAKKNIFQYGNRTDQWAPSRQRSHQTHAPSMFPFMVSKQFDYFNFQDCTYSMPKNKESTARITMFHKLRIPFVFTLEASFAGANRGHLAGKHFSQRDFENVGLYVLKAMWELKKLELNKNLLKQITEEATKNARASGDDGDGSDDSSSEEDEIQTTSKKAIAIIQEQEGSPRRQSEAPNPSVKDSINQALNPQGSAQKAKQAPNAPQSNLKGKQTQNRSIISLKTITQGNEAISSNSPRKQAQGDRLHRESLGSSPVRRSIAKPQNQQFQHLDSGGMAWVGDGNSEANYHQNNNFPGPPNRDSIHPQSEGNRPNSKSNDGDFIFDLTKNLVRTENPDTITGDRSGLSSVDSHSQQQELFVQFNAQIEQSFTEQQLHLDEIFRQTAKQFLEQRGQPSVNQNPHSGANYQNQQLNNMRAGYGNSRSQNTQSRFSGNNNDIQGNSPNKNGKQNWFLEQFLQQQKQNYQRDRGANSINPRQQGYFSNDQHSQPHHLFSANSVQQQQQQSHAQIQTFLQLQKLHQMQKLNQMAQMQFFRQQAELLLSQNLTQQQQWEVFQQFSYYQAQIQMQNQQYQMMLSQSLHGNNMQVLKAQYASAAAAALQNQTNQGFSGGNLNTNSGGNQINDGQSSVTQKFMEHHQFNRQRRFATTQGSIFKSSQANKSSKGSEYTTKQQDPQLHQINLIDPNPNDSRTQSPLKQQEKFTLKESEQIRVHQDFQSRPTFSNQEEMVTESTPQRSEEQIDDYVAVNSPNKRQKASYARNSVTALNPKGINQSLKQENRSQTFSEEQLAAETQLKDKNDTGHPSRQTNTNRNSTANQSQQQSVIKLKKGLVEFKQPQGPQQAINFHTNYKYPPEINAAPQFEPQNFSQLLNQHLVDQQYQHLPSQGSSLNSSNQVNQSKKFFTTRGKFPKPPQHKQPEGQDNESYEVHRNQNYGSRKLYSNNMTGEQIKPNSQNFNRAQANRHGSQFAASYFEHDISSSTNPGSQNYQTNMRQNNLQALQGLDKNHHRFLSDAKHEIASPDLKYGKEYLQTSNTKSNYSMKKHQQFMSTDANFKMASDSKAFRGHERNLTDAQQMYIVNSPPVRKEPNQYYAGNLNSSTGGAQIYNKNDTTSFEVTIGKSKLIPVLHPQRQTYVSSNDSMLQYEKSNQPIRGAPGTAGGKSGTSSGLAQNYGVKSENLALNKSQDENIMKKHYGLGSGSKIQTPSQVQKYNNFQSASRQQAESFCDGDVNRPKNSRHLQPVDFGSFSAPISQNTRKTPSQLKYYPPDPNQRQTIPTQNSNQTPHDQQLPLKMESPQKSMMSQNKKKSHQIRTLEKYDITDKAINFTQSNDRVNLNTSQAKFSDYNQQQTSKQPVQISKQSQEREYQEHLNYQQIAGSQSQQKHQEIQQQLKSREPTADSQSFPIISSQNQKSEPKQTSIGGNQNKQNR